MATESVPMDDKELFRGAMDDAPAEEAVTPQPEAEAQPEQNGQPRDEHGRFAPKAEEKADAAPTQQQATTEPKTETKDEEGAQVPSWRLREVREAREAAERRAEEAGRQAYVLQQNLQQMQRQLAELQKSKQEPVDFFADPNAAFKQQVSPIEERINSIEGNFRMSMSRMNATIVHGKEAVAEAEKAVAEAIRANDPGLQTLTAQLRTTDDPVGAAVAWHASRKVMNETGGDIAKFREKVLADAMKDPAFQAKVLEAARGTAQQNTGAPNVQLPPSLNRTAGSGVTAADLSSEDMDSGALFRHAMGDRR